MRKFVMRYPGDPPCEVVLMDRAEFLSAYPREPIIIGPLDLDTSLVIPDKVIPMRPDQIECDLCAEDPGDEIYVVRGTKAYCKTCFDRGCRRHCKEVK